MFLNRQTDRQADRQADRQTDRRTDFYFCSLARIEDPYKGLGGEMVQTLAVSNNVRGKVVCISFVTLSAFIMHVEPATQILRCTMTASFT